MPLVSIIIPTYNRQEWLVEAINSVLAQLFKDYEIIVVDDGSTDQSREIVRNVKYLYQKNSGPAKARNLGVKHAQGKYIAFLDSDDLWQKKKLETQINFLKENPEYKICYTNENWLRNGKHLNQKKHHQKYSGWIFEKTLPLCIISASSILLEKKIFADIGGFDESLPVCEDYDLWMRLAQRYPIYFVDQPLIIKRGGHSDQLSKKYWGMDRFRIKALEKILKENLTLKQRKLVKEEVKRKCEVLIAGGRKRKNIPVWFTYSLKKLLTF